MNPRIVGIGTVNPPYRVGQSEVRELVRAMFDRLQGIDRLIGVFENTGIEARHFSAPLEWFAADHPFAEKNALWAETALSMSETASRKALEQAGVRSEQIAAVVFVSTTGIATPSLEAHLVQHLGIPLSCLRLPLWGLGCAGGVAGLARAAELAHARPQQYVLMVAVELCSLTFVRNDISKSNLVATSLFADGAAAVVLGAGSGPEVIGGFSRLLPQSYEVMGWDVQPGGLQVRFAQSIPNLVVGELGNLIRDGLASFGLSALGVGSWALHPGGAKVLAAYREAMHIDEHSFEASWCVLKKFGNMSSPTALFVLQRLMNPLEPIPAGTPGAVLALGPGFAAEGVVLRW
ncbi:MAG: stilbene synthase [Thermaceae bacterium]|nr:stilbene synthase [Thermaceae bacterium]